MRTEVEKLKFGGLARRGPLLAVKLDGEVEIIEIVEGWVGMGIKQVVGEELEGEEQEENEEERQQGKLLFKEVYAFIFQIKESTMAVT